MTNRKPMLLLLAVFAFLMPFKKALAHVETTYYLKGKLGERALALKMLCYDEMPIRQLYFFFLDDKRDGYLKGQSQNNFWRFLPEQKGGATTQVALNLAPNRDGSWKGSWTDSSGKSQEVVFNPIHTDSIASPFSRLSFVQELDPYEKLRLSVINFTKVRTEKGAKGLLCDWYEEKTSGLSFFRLRSLNGSFPTDSINHRLETIHLSLLQKYFQSGAPGAAAKVEATSLYFTQELVSFRILTTNPSAGKSLQVKDLFTLDLKSGEDVNLEDLVWFDQTAARPPMDDLFKLYKYRKNTFGPRLFQLLQELYPGQMKSDSCGINKAENWALPKWGLTAKGIAFGFNTPGSCDVLDWAIVPYQKLEPFLEERYPLKAKR